MKVRRVVLLSIGLAVIGACDYGAGSAQPYRPPALAQSPLPETGEELYLKDCAWCHGDDGEGTRYGPDIVTGTNGPALVDFVLSSGRMPLDSPQQVMDRGETIYTRPQIDAIVRFTGSLGAPGPDIPEVDLHDADLALGGELYQENCAACHSTTGIGGALTRGAQADDPSAVQTSVVAPPVVDATATEVAEAIRTGPGTMPVFGAANFDDDDVDAIVRYVAYLKDPVDRGGAGIGRVGPVAEGAVGWILGLGVLLLFCRWIGTKQGES